MTIAEGALSETPIGAQSQRGNSKKPMNLPPGNRRIVAKTDTSEQPEPR
jgi:hypothetical protein